MHVQQLSRAFFSHSESQFGLPVRHRFDSVLWLWLFSNIVNNGQSLTDVKRLNKNKYKKVKHKKEEEESCVCFLHSE